jgi:IstB-like ATP binding protein
MDVVTKQEDLLPCRCCGRQFTPTTVPVTIGGRPIVSRPTVCGACADAAILQPSSAGPRSEWQRLCPPRYQRDLPDEFLVRPWVNGVLRWQYGPEGLLVVGETGTGKTWVMWWLLRRLLEERRSVVTLDAVTYRSGLTSAARQGDAAGYARRLALTDVLYWDDFGQTPLSGAASEMLLHVVEQRTSHERPLLLTSQYSGYALESQFERQQMGTAVRRRINDFCRIVKTSKEPAD